LDQARGLHEPKAGVLDKSKPKRRLSVCRSPLLRLQLKPAHFECCSGVNLRLLHLSTVVAPVIIKEKQQKSKG